MIECFSDFTIQVLTNGFLIREWKLVCVSLDHTYWSPDSPYQSVSNYSKPSVTSMFEHTALLRVSRKRQSNFYTSLYTSEPGGHVFFCTSLLCTSTFPCTTLTEASLFLSHRKSFTWEPGNIHFMLKFILIISSAFCKR